MQPACDTGVAPRKPTRLAHMLALHGLSTQPFPLTLSKGATRTALARVPCQLSCSLTQPAAHSLDLNDVDLGGAPPLARQQAPLRAVDPLGVGAGGEALRDGPLVAKLAAHGVAAAAAGGASRQELGMGCRGVTLAPRHGRQFAVQRPAPGGQQQGDCGFRHSPASSASKAEAQPRLAGHCLVWTWAAQAVAPRARNVPAHSGQLTSCKCRATCRQWRSCSLRAPGCPSAKRRACRGAAAQRDRQSLRHRDACASNGCSKGKGPQCGVG